METAKPMYLNFSIVFVLVLFGTFVFWSFILDSKIPIGVFMGIFFAGALGSVLRMSDHALKYKNTIKLWIIINAGIVIQQLIFYPITMDTLLDIGLLVCMSGCSFAIYCLYRKHNTYPTFSL